MIDFLHTAADRILALRDGVFGSRSFTVSTDEGVAALQNLRGSQGRLGQWIFGPLRSADQEVKRSARGLRSAARTLVASWGFARRFQDLLATNVIGEPGIRLQMQVEEDDGSLDRDFNREAEAAWHRWGKPGQCTVDGRQSWHQVQRLAVETLSQDGEVLLRLRPGYQNAFRFAVQLLDPDQLDDRLNRTATEDQNAIRFGVELNSDSKPVAYWIHRGHPSERVDVRSPERTHVRLPAEEVVHLYLLRRIGQTRGLSWFAPVLSDSKMLQGYQEAELVAARTAAAKMGFFQTDPELEFDPNLFSGDQREIRMEAEPGVMEELPAGWTFQAWDPQHPNAAFPDFLKAMLRSFSSGLGAMYNTVANDLEGVNFSSLRQGNLTERDVWKMIQRFVAEHLHERVFQMWIRQAVLSDQLELPELDFDRFTRHRWQPRGWDWVDPKKQAEGKALELRMGVTSRTRIAAERGDDLEEILEEQRREKEIMEDMGLDPTTDFSVSGGDDDESDEGEGNRSGPTSRERDPGGRRVAPGHASGNGRPQVSTRGGRRW